MLNKEKQRLHKKDKLLSSTLKLISRVLSYISHFWQFKVTVILLIIATIFDVLTPALIGNIIDIIGAVAATSELPTEFGLEWLFNLFFNPTSIWVAEMFNVNLNFALLAVLSLSLIVIASLTNILNYLQRYALAYISQKAAFDLRSDLYNSLLEQSFSFYDNQRTGQLMARATGDVNEVQRFFSFGIRMLLSSGLLFILVIYFLVTINLQLTLFSIAFLPLVLLTTFKFSSKMGPVWGKVREQFGVITSVTQENLMGVRVVKGFSRESFEEEKFKREGDNYFDINMEAARLRAFYMPLATLITSIGVVFIILYGGRQVIIENLTLGSLIAFYFYVARLSGPIRMIGFITARVQRATAASERIFEIMDTKVDVSDKDDAIELKKIEGHVVFTNVWFSYDRDNMVLKNINLKVKPGKTIAILGATGSGKSSIINLIPRFYDVNEGSITIDGHNIRDVTIKSLRRHVGIVRQDPFIFSSTIMKNIAFGVDNVKLEEAEAVAKSVKIHEFISSLPEGYNTKVGERGVTLSGGQKQRIAIARALLKNPKILILDDSTSSVDTQTEYEIQKALEKLFENRTTFIITQRLSSIRNADYIVILERGKIVEEGTHNQLLVKKGSYYKLYQTQLAKVRESEEEKLV